MYVGVLLISGAGTGLCRWLFARYLTAAEKKGAGRLIYSTVDGDGRLSSQCLEINVQSAPSELCHTGAFDLQLSACHQPCDRADLCVPFHLSATCDLTSLISLSAFFFLFWLLSHRDFFSFLSNTPLSLSLVLYPASAH